MDTIRKYLIEEKRMSDIIAERTISKLKRNPDIASELMFWITNRTYDMDAPVIIEGYTAADIFKLAPFMDGIGVFTFLISLREQPERAKDAIAAGFPRK